MRGQQCGGAALGRGFVGVDDKQRLALLNPLAFLHGLRQQNAGGGSTQFERAHLCHEDARHTHFACNFAPSAKCHQGTCKGQRHSGHEAKTRMVCQVNAA